MTNFREHGVMLYLSKELYTAFIKLQADRGLGRSYAGLLPFVEGMYKLGYISREVYETHFEKYSEKLVKPEPLTVKQLKEKEEIEKLNKHYLGVLEAWPALREEVRKAHLRKAEEVADKVSNAKLVLTLANGKAVSLEAMREEAV